MKLNILEARLRQLIEVRLIRALPGSRPEDLLVQRLVEAIQTGARTEPDGTAVAPNVFTLMLHTSSHRRWQNPGLMDALLRLIKTAAADAGLKFESPPKVTFRVDPSVAADDLRILASHSAEPVSQTQEMKKDTDAPRGEAESSTIPENAFLIIDGIKEFHLKQPVVNIGRRLDNDLVVDDPRVSRHHAQLRAIKNRYVLFDLNSSGGTFINGQRTAQTVLYPGDVISLAGVSLIFGQDIPLPRRDLGQTGPRSRAGSDRPTAIIQSKPLGIRKKE